MYIGSGDVGALLMGLNTDGHQRLLQRFVSGEKPYYNAKASPIDALRTGAILEERYMLILPENYYPQFKKQCTNPDVLISTIDFAKIENGEVVDFEELKTCNFDDFLEFEKFRYESGAVDFVKKNYKKNYAQVQFQLLCTGLNNANLVFLAVYSYDDKENEVRDIKENEYIKIKIYRDEKVISNIIERAKIFQTIKDYYNG